MNSRERVMTALRNEKPDRVPFVDFVDEELQLKITGGKKMNTAEFAKHLGMDGIFMPGYYGDYCAPVFSTGTGPHVGEGIIKTREDLSKVVFPDADDPSFYDKANSFIDDLLPLGFNALNPIEPPCMDMKEVKDKWGDKVCLWGNIDLVETLPRGTVEQTEAEVKQRIQDAGKGGGFICATANSVTDFCKVENVLAMTRAVKKYGKYPIT